MNKEFFKPEDFPNVIGLRDEAAEDANKKLQKLIESWPRVYGQKGNSLEGFQSWEMSDSTHKARLAFIEPIVKEPCQHEPDFINWGYKNPKCKHCGVELIAKWEEKK